MPSFLICLSIKEISEVFDRIADDELTHNEILYFGYRILQNNHTALYATRVKFPFIFIDEFQDTNPFGLNAPVPDECTLIPKNNHSRPSWTQDDDTAFPASPAPSP